MNSIFAGVHGQGELISVMLRSIEKNPYNAPLDFFKTNLLSGYLSRHVITMSGTMRTFLKYTPCEDLRQGKHQSKCMH